MCRFASFFHNPITSEIKIKVLDSHGDTEKQLKLDPKIWREGHYTPDGKIELRLVDNDRVDKTEYETAFKNRFPTFVSFLNWAMDESKGIYIGSLDLHSLTSLPENIKLPKEISGSLDLHSLTSLPENIKLPEKCGSLYLNSLTSLPENIKLPEKCDYLYLNSQLRQEWEKKLEKQRRGA